MPRLPSWPGRCRDVPEQSPYADTSNCDLVFNEADRVCHKSSVNDMAEALRVAMMSKPTLETLDPRYNSHVLHLIEGYSRLQATLVDTQRQLDKALAGRHNEADDAATLAAGWAIQEALYKAEIKRLEVTVHRISGNSLEAVVMARSGSLVERRGRPRLSLVGQAEQDPGE